MGNPERKRPLERPRRNLMDNIRIDLAETYKIYRKPDEN
jgi:hypothetical protein